MVLLHRLHTLSHLPDLQTKGKGNMETKQLIAEILKHEELHDLITHLGDFKQAVEGELDMAKDAVHLDDYYDYQANSSYWERQLKTVNRLIGITEGEV